ncbi:hypothetical protein EVAR_33714_1 [Eumeta japonica]|uniref:Uncharacterized protein n=1 Tax=Eumeta variegata TaxID=151549 RepID=A0A4C1VSP7_EUMVA|nr:hypothetical protein EVAR_33714_1 [Eumeta japonica]
MWATTYLRTASGSRTGPGSESKTGPNPKLRSGLASVMSVETESESKYDLNRNQKRDQSIQKKRNSLYVHVGGVAGNYYMVVNAPYKKGMPGQCHGCQPYGHAAANCYVQLRCVNCECTRESGSKPSCYNCGQKHMAIYRGYPEAPKPKPIALNEKNRSAEVADLVAKLRKAKQGVDCLSIILENQALIKERALALLDGNSVTLLSSQFETCLLWKLDNEVIPESYNTAVRSLRNLEKKLLKDDRLKNEYCKRINNLLKNSHTGCRRTCVPLVHIFVDTRGRSYAAAVCWRVKLSENETAVSFIIGKARVAPLQIISIPRLELQATLLGARLTSSVLNIIELNVTRKIFWTDSRPVLYLGSVPIHDRSNHLLLIAGPNRRNTRRDFLCRGDLLEIPHKASHAPSTPPCVVWPRTVKLNRKPTNSIADSVMLSSGGLFYNRHLTFRFDNTYSSVRPIRAGEPQGSTLSPHLYSVYVNIDTLRSKTGIQLALFADDTTLFLRSNCLRGILPHYRGPLMS